MSEAVLLDVAGISAGYRRVAILHRISLALAAGERLAVVGANGAGKTTLLRAIMGQIPLSAGRIRFAGEVLDGASIARRARAGLGYCPEGRQLFPLMSVAENLELGAARVAAAERRLRREEVLAIFPRLRNLLSREAGLLSGGEQQMVAIGRALMGRPRLLLLDEPSTGLAPRIVHELYAALAGLAAVAILVVEQNARAALRFADRAIVLADGAIVAAAPAAELRDDPRVVEAYVGVGRTVAA